jgi:hypothetical protein
MGERGRTRRAREFDIDVMVSNIETLYERLYGETDRGRAEGFAACAMAA